MYRIFLAATMVLMFTSFPTHNSNAAPRLYKLADLFGIALDAGKTWFKSVGNAASDAIKNSDNINSKIRNSFIEHMDQLSLNKSSMFEGADDLTMQNGMMTYFSSMGLKGTDGISFYKKLEDGGTKADQWIANRYENMKEYRVQCSNDGTCPAGYDADLFAASSDQVVEAVKTDLDDAIKKMPDEVDVPASLRKTDEVADATDTATDSNFSWDELLESCPK